MSDFTIEVPQASIVRMVAWPKQSEKVTRMTVTDAATNTMSLAASLAPYLRGALRRSIVFNPGTTLGSQLKSIQLKEGDTSAVVGSNLPYARIQDVGGTIRPKAAQFLRWQNKDGSWAMARSVTLKGNKYMTTAYQNVQRTIASLYDKWFNKFFSE